MTPPRPDPLAGWRAARAARLDDTTVATIEDGGGNAEKPQKSATVAIVSTVAGEDGKLCSARASEMGAAVLPGQTMPPEPLPWWALDYDAERGHAFAEARTAPGACPICAGLQWWWRSGTDESPTCATCHPPPPRLVVDAVSTESARSAHAAGRLGSLVPASSPCCGAYASHLANSLST